MGMLLWLHGLNLNYNSYFRNEFGEFLLLWLHGLNLNYDS